MDKCFTEKCFWQLKNGSYLIKTKYQYFRCITVERQKHLLGLCMRLNISAPSQYEALYSPNIVAGILLGPLATRSDNTAVTDTLHRGSTCL